MGVHKIRQTNKPSEPLFLGFNDKYKYRGNKYSLI